MRELIMRLRDWLRRDALDRELAEELCFHAERLQQDLRYGLRGLRRSPGFTLAVVMTPALRSD